MEKNICIIPLRSKSKGLKNKNIKKINKIPLCMFAISETIKSNIFEKIFIAIDDKKYENLILRYIKFLKIKKKKIIFFYRSKKSSTDIAQTEIVLKEVIRKNNNYKNCFLIQVTSPLLLYSDIQKSNKILKKGYDSIFSSYISKKFFWKFVKSKLCSLNYNYLKRTLRQNSGDTFIENGAIYGFNIRGFLDKNNRLFGRIATYVMPEERSLDIDTIKDFVQAKKKLKLRFSKFK